MTLTCCVNNNSLNSQRNVDPTRTFSLRKRFEAILVKRFRKIRKKILEVIIEDDVFGLIATNVLEQGRFAFPKSADKVSSFMSWLEQAEAQDILETFYAFDGRRKESSWMNIYIRSAYQREVLRAAAELKKRGIPYLSLSLEEIFMSPFHADAVALLYTRSFNELKGITNEMDKQISRVLAEGLANGENPRKIAYDIVDRVDKIGITRAGVLARKEIIRAHHEANMNEYELAGISDLEVYAELLTAGDSRVCQRCFALEKRSKAKPYTIEEMRGVIPVHPNCRCVAVPFTKEFRELKNRRKR